ncbi:MAG: Cell elongation-specific peptidoglycan biosynthesis regulator RodA [Candidatus Uhrbacteria bacterium GW2011_GWF2_41_16]|uniref:Cell elongation-specific peptidoglycan biosynthesis regulator RodA n=2 Tax=Candidatus Uhriibacteriota TaxID=1752732 RepID=A0A0G0VCX7_9BACT|nr:MAG: Cell elongation-specific peptidoglycan biosynthesis regulator RodA [Candidatus Uhrbacteria bacterium GW2011_GWA2_41_10]KKR87799.1 MAG: Cell elongation-specific peptidoglycan biosynthesis regulator RodA [Candidatus Uhrbacteria bacterium GW2011_GWC2_41_11]KKR98738.1 MAG: Cell elongation-specific peptidoglycan biosynthesis regulator RodA [Candidatus Uhrbacteria bacterium GW2011_GWF2_41_16]
MSRFFAFCRRADWLLLLATVALVSFGFSAMYSITLSQSGTGGGFLQKQLIAFGIGIIFFLFMARANYRLLRSYSILFYIGALLSLIGVLFLGITNRGTTGWFVIGSFHFQPVEFAKLALVILLARYFSEQTRRPLGLRACLESGFLTSLLVGFTLLQPDLGSALLLVGTWFLLLIFVGIKKRYLFGFIGIGVIICAFSWQFLLADFQRARLRTFLDPAADPSGQGYNVRQAVIAVGSGQWFGRGLGFGSQSQLKFIPESQTDFIFAVIAEEFGFVGVLVLLSAFFLLFQRLLHYASLTSDDFTSALLIGIGSLLFLQFLVNVGMNIGLLPVTGIALPLVSYGGSSLLMTLAMLGIAESVAIRMAGSRPLSSLDKTW